MSTRRYELRERIEAVANASAEGDNLLTVAVPPDESLDEVRKRVQEDHAGAEYIGDDQSSQGRREALERARRTLQEYDETPDTGLVLYVGEVGGGEDVVHVFDDLPEPVGASTFEWSNEFDIEALETADRLPAGATVRSVSPAGPRSGRTTLTSAGDS